MERSYTGTAKAFHWLTVLGIALVIPLGIGMVNAEPGPLQNRLFDAHRSFGIVILVITAMRLAWRQLHPPPRLPDDLPDWQSRTALITHWTLYVLLFVIPILGWLGSNYFGASVSIFGLFTLPDLVAKNRDLAEVILRAHVACVAALVGVLALHIGAAIHHHVVRRDLVLRRMMPGPMRPPSQEVREPATNRFR